MPVWLGRCCLGKAFECLAGYKCLTGYAHQALTGEAPAYSMQQVCPGGVLPRQKATGNSMITTCSQNTFCQIPATGRYTTQRLCGIVLMQATQLTRPPLFLALSHFPLRTQTFEL